MESSTDTDTFFASLPRLASGEETFETVRYQPAPDDWRLVVTDLVGSTQAVAAGRHKTVNFVAASAIAALKNLCAPIALPFLFGGDGSVVMVPPRHAAAAAKVLARIRGFARREFGLDLRVGMATVAAIRAHGGEVLVGRYEPSPGNSFGVFLGGGVALLEAAVRGRRAPALGAEAVIDEGLDDGLPPDLNGLSCRWDSLRSQRGRMVTLIIQGAREPRAVHAEVLRLASGAGDPRPVRLDTLRTRWPPVGFMLEARAVRGSRPLWVAVLEVLKQTLIARLLFLLDRPVGGFDPQKYRAEITTNTDFCKHDDTVSFVLDCPTDGIAAIRTYLETQHAAGAFRFGMHVSETALMTCLVASATQNQHVHFVDGGDGGYTAAAKGLKAQAAAASA